MSIVFTDRETQEKNHTVNDAIVAAKAILAEQRITHPNLSSVQDISGKEKVTIVTLNNLSSKIVHDTYRHPIQ